MKGKSTFTLLIIILVAAGLGALSFFGVDVGENHLFGVNGIKQGLDLKGGVSITYQVEEGVSPTTEQMNSAQALLQQRLDRRGYTEAEVAIQGGNRLRIDIPDIDDVEEAIAQIGQTAQLFFTTDGGEDGDNFEVLLTGEHISNAYRSTGDGTSAGQIVIVLEFDSEGSRLFEQATADNVGRQLWIWLDDQPLSWPTVNERISGGSAIITGGFTASEAEELAALIRSGSLPFRLDILSTNNIGAKLGANSLETSILAGIIGFALILLFMLAVYRVAGLAANLALVIYVALVLILLSLFRVTLTLPGIAGIVLSVGMAIDANVVIFERIKEEIAGGRTMRAAIKTGFRRALPAIIDSNITSLLVALVLFWLGSGPIKGFAQTLALGIVVSMFTAIVLTRLIIIALTGMGLMKPTLFGKPKVVPEPGEETKNLPIIASRKKAFIVSAALILVGFITMGVFAISNQGAFNYDVEFIGGTALQVDIGRDFNNDDVSQIVREITGQQAPQVQRVTGTTIVLVKMTTLDQETRMALVERLIQGYGLEADDVSFEDVSSTVSNEMTRIAIMAVAAATLAMLVYITIRFRDLRKGGCTVLALMHDALIVLGAYALLRIPLNYSFIAAMLSVIGYSINANIILFDRIRENEKLMTRPSPVTLVDVSVTQTLTRTIYTSLSTMLVVACLYVLGVPSIREFTLPLLIGMAAGTYSTVFLVGPMWYMTLKDKTRVYSR
jgi:SecD/SecF fusion protein